MRKLEARGFFCRMCGESDGDGEECPPVGQTGEEQALVITDDIVMAGICELRKIACIGYCPPESEETGSGESLYFPHVRMVWESFEDREPEELEQFRCRFYREPVVIARTERLLIRESIPKDFEAVYQMESDMAFGQECREGRKKICFCSAAGDGRKEKKEDCETEETFCFHEKNGEFCSYNEEKEKFCSYIENVYPFYGYGYWTVELAEPGREGTVIGRCGLKDYEPGEDDGYIVMKKEAGDGSRQIFQPEPFCLELGYVVAEPYRRQGYAYEMCQAVLDYAFAALCADAVVVRIHSQNRASLKLARKLGFLNLVLQKKQEREKQASLSHALGALAGMGI